MSIFNNILFLQDYPTSVRAATAVPSDYSQGYGNRVASARVFAPLGHARHADPRNAGAPAAPSAAFAHDRFPLRACG